jgi:hypothetical protein
MGNAQLMFQEIGQPVVEIPRTHLDMMIAFKKAKAFGSHIGLTSFSEPTDGIDFIEEILNIKIHQIIFENFAEMETGVNEAFNQGVRVLVGGGVSTKIAASSSNPDRALLKKRSGKPGRLPLSAAKKLKTLPV